MSIAKTILTEQSRRIQAKGWNFNTDYDYQLALAVDNTVTIPADALRIDYQDASKDYVWRAGKLYDRYNQSFDLSDAGAPKCTIVRFYPFEDLPESARYYIALKSARIFQKRILGDDSLDAFTQADEMEARADFEEDVGESANRNMLNDAETYGMVRASRGPHNFFA